MLKSTPEARPWFERLAVRSLAMTGDDTPPTSVQPRNGQSAPLPSTSEGSETTAAVTTRGYELGRSDTLGYVHSGPSVSAPTVRFYSVGTELHLIGYRNDWFQVLDPVASERGWIYAKYYLQAIRGPGQGIARLASAGKASTKSS